MRGKQSGEREPTVPLRIIPAHAGQTPRRHMSVLSPSDHPRACGANASSPMMTGMSDGSSPRMRGKPHAREAVTHHDRIIPAHAGQTSTRTWAPPATKDHPRACGANLPRWFAHNNLSGSSPRMRGKRRWLVACLVGYRIIPAHAGQTPLELLFCWRATDHPRACGANVNLPPTCDERYGSSPRMRGKRRARYLV